MWQEEYGGFTLQRGLTPVARAILVATIAVYVLQRAVDARTGGAFSYLFGLCRPCLWRGWVWQPVTYMFLHGGLWHIFLNMFALYMFGRELESVLGARRFLTLYFGCGVLGGLGWVLLSASGGLCIGASGGVFGLMGTFAALFPYRRITLLLFFVLPVTMTARTMAVLLGVITFAAMFGDGNIAHAAHLAGGLAGYIYGRRLAQHADRGIGRRPGKWIRRAMDGAGVNGAAPDEAPTPEEIDRILDKITAEGIGGLTRRERRMLEQAGRRQAQSD